MPALLCTDTRTLLLISESNRSMPPGMVRKKHTSSIASPIAPPVSDGAELVAQQVPEDERDELHARVPGAVAGATT